jgi:hypothetical protein
MSLDVRKRVIDAKKRGLIDRRFNQLDNLPTVDDITDW